MLTTMIACTATMMTAPPPVEAARPRMEARHETKESVSDATAVEVRVEGRPEFYLVTRLDLDAPSDTFEPLDLRYIPERELTGARIAFDLQQFEKQPPTNVTLTLLDDKGAVLSKQKKIVVDFRAEIRAANASGRPSPSIPAFTLVRLVAKFEFPEEHFPKIRTAVIGFERTKIGGVR
jgi:hypothetical protein